MTRFELCRLIAGVLAEGGSEAEEASREARMIVREACGLSEAEYLAGSREEADDAARDAALQMAKRRAGREPLQYILGRAPFCGRDFAVGPGVLIPRFDTEILVEEALASLAPGMEVLDLCTGSGCVAVTLALEGPPGIAVTASDLSEAALRTAEQNAHLLKAQVRVRKSDLFEKLPGRYDIITANPPYIPSGDIPALMPEVSRFEPREALDGGADGLDFYRILAREAPGHLKEGGRLLMEIGYDEADAVLGLLRAAGFADTGMRRDLSGLPRVVFGTRP